MEDIKLSLCITTYNRPELTIHAFEKVYDDPRIDEIVIVDDCSTDKNFNALLYFVGEKRDAEGMNCKIQLHKNRENLGMSRNKAKSLELATNDWCLLFDSDNVLDVDYIDAFYRHLSLIAGLPRPHLIYCPDYAQPNFDYRQYAGTTYYARECAKYARHDIFNCMLNTCNYIVNKHEYAKIFVANKEHIASDTIWFNYNWLKAGRGFYLVPGMHYYHRVHKDSGFMQDATYNMQKSAEVRNLIMEL